MSMNPLRAYPTRIRTKSREHTMCHSSDEDFMDDRVRRLRRSPRLPAVGECRTKRMKHDTQELRTESVDTGGKKPRELQLADLEAASEQDRIDVQAILEIKKAARITWAGVAGQKQNNRCSLGTPVEDKNQDERRTAEKEGIKILSLLMDRAEYGKRKEEVYKEFEERFKDQHGAYCRIRSILFLLKTKRRTGQKLPSVKDLASYLFKGEKGLDTTFWQEKQAGDILIHTIRSVEYNGNRGHPLTKVQQTILELENL